MQDLITFVTTHVLLCAAFAAIFVLLIGNELYSRLSGGRKCNPQEMALFLSHQSGSLIDLRAKADFNAGHIAGAINLPFAELETQFQKIKASKDNPLILVDSNGQQGHSASAFFRKQGFAKVYFLAGGIALWRQDHLPLVKK